MEQCGQPLAGGVRQAKAQGKVDQHFRQPERQPAQHIEQQAVAGQDGQDPQHQPVHREPAQGGVQPRAKGGGGDGSHENRAPSKSAEYSACTSAYTVSQAQSNSCSSRGPSTKNNAVASASATIAVPAMAQQATTVRTGAPVVPSRTWWNPSPQPRRLAAEAHRAPAPSWTVPIARVGS